MYINKKRIVSVDNVLLEFKEGEEVYIILNLASNLSKKLKDIGFNTLDIGSSVLPKKIGSVSRYNADGKYELLREEPKEPYCIDRDMTFLAYGKHEVTKSVTFTYNRYQRKLILAPTQELSIILDKDNNKIISSDLITYNKENKKLIKHVINLFLELFGECQLVDKNLISRIKTPIKKLNWNIMPKGKMPWKELEKQLLNTTNINSSRNSKEIYARINYINSFEPDFFAVGNGGFNDYIVLGFEKKNIFILENRLPKNATYVFKKNWEEITKLTKAQILAENLQEDRIIHSFNWKDNIKRYLK
ncbi:MAG: hypothetical protein KKD75_02815 [Nanoarchaeota archaeon]|nr:hypothetical protein [Nanoarchaeota archaeon]